MLFDKQNLLSEDQAVTASAVSENIIDLGDDHARVQVLNEKNAKILAQVTADFDALTSLAFILQTDNDVAFGSPTVLDTQSDVLANLVAGKGFIFHLPRNCERYIRLSYVVTGSDATVGTIMAGVVLEHQTNQARN